MPGPPTTMPHVPCLQNRLHANSSALKSLGCAPAPAQKNRIPGNRERPTKLSTALAVPKTGDVVAVDES